MTKINELLPLHNVQYEKNTASGCTIRKNNVRSHVLNGCFWLDENYSCIISHNISKPVNKLNQSNTNTSLFQTIKLSKGQVWFIHISLHSLQLVFYIKDFEDRNMTKTTMIGVLQYLILTYTYPEIVTLNTTPFLLGFSKLKYHITLLKISPSKQIYVIVKLKQINDNINMVSLYKLLLPKSQNEWQHKHGELV